MFHIDCTFEDSRIVANSQDGTVYSVTMTDALTGKQGNIELTPKQLSDVLAINFDSNGTPQGFEAMYRELELLMAQLPPECRLIP